MKILKFPGSDPGKFGSKKALKRKDGGNEEAKQLNLFSAGRMLKLHPLSPFEEALLVDERGDKEAARELYLQAIRVGDRVADAYCNLGILECRADRTIEAINYLTLSLKQDPRHPEAHFNLANMYVDAGNPELGIVHYQLAIEIEPDFSNSYFNLGLTLAAAGKYEEAIDVLNRYCGIASSEELQPANELIQKLQILRSEDE